jgi:hypothetical protein
LFGWSFLFAIHEFKELSNLLSISVREKDINIKWEYRISEVYKSQALHCYLQMWASSNK